MTSLSHQSSEFSEQDLTGLGGSSERPSADPRVTVHPASSIAQSIGRRPVRPERFPLVCTLAVACVAMVAYDLVLLVLSL